MIDVPLSTALRRVSTVLLALSLSRCLSCGAGQIHPDAIAHVDTGIDYLQRGRCLEAEERCRLALEYSDRFEHPHNCLGMVELQCRNDIDKAADHFKAALAINSDFAEAHINLGVTFFRRNPPEYDAACEEFKAALEIDPANLNGRENYGLCLMRRGAIAMDLGEKAQAEDNFREAKSQLVRLIELKPDNFDAHHHLGFIALKEKRYEDAEQRFKRCLEIDPENPVCCYNLGNTYLETARCEEAIQAYICSIRSGTDTEISIPSRQNLGVSYELCAKKDGAIKVFLDRIKSDPGNPAHHFDLGNVYADKGLFDRAVNEWENTVRLDPLYCSAYYSLAMAANKNLESERTIQNCQQLVSCVTERQSKGSAAAGEMGEQVEQCKQLVRRLEME